MTEGDPTGRSDTPTAPAAEVYLGDGAYVEVRGGELVIYTSNGLHRTNSIVCEYHAARALAAFIMTRMSLLNWSVVNQENEKL